MSFKKGLFPALAAYYLFSITVFTSLRLVFILLNDNPGQAYTTVDLFMSLFFGFIVDSCISSCILLGALFVSYPFFYFGRKIYRPLGIVTGILCLACILLNLVDTGYYRQFGCRVNYQALEIFHDKDLVLLKSLGKTFSFYLVVLIFFMFIFLFYRSYQKRKNSFDEGIVRGKHFLYCAFMLVPLSFLYVGPPFWMLSASSSSLLNVASLNGAYTLVKSIDQNSVYKESIPDFRLCEDDVAVSGILEAVVKPDEKLLPGSIPTLREIHNKLPFVKKHIVIIIMESFGANYIGRLNENGQGFSPYFDALSKEGMLLTACRSNGPRTQHGIISTVSGFPAIQGINLQRRKGVNPLGTIGNVLGSAGYRTQYIHNGDAGFDDMSDFFRQGGFERVVDVSDFETWKFRHNWGVCDEDLYEKAYPLIWDENKTPTLSVLMTLSNHFPYKIPPDFIAQHPEVNRMDEKQAAFYYSDYALGKFIQKCKSNPEYTNTLFLITADHGEPHQPEDNDYKIFHIPALLLNSSMGTGTFNSVCSQCDFGTTLLHEINYPGKFQFIGQDIFNKDYKPFAVSRPYGEDVLLSTDSVVIRFYYETKQLKYYRLIGQRTLQEIKDAGNRYRDETDFLLKYLQGTSYIFKSGKYSLGNS